MAHALGILKPLFVKIPVQCRSHQNRVAIVFNFTRISKIQYENIMAQTTNTFLDVINSLRILKGRMKQTMEYINITYQFSVLYWITLINKETTISIYRKLKTSVVCMHVNA